MRWSKVRKLVEDSFADSVKGRVTVHMTQTSRGEPWACTCGHGWLSIDKRRAAWLHTHDSYDRFGTPHHESVDVSWSKTWGSSPGTETVYWAVHESVETRDRTPGVLAEPGEFSRFDLALSCWKYLHTSLRESLESENPIIRALAMLNAKVGRQRLAQYAAAETHPLPKALAEFRITVEREARARRGRTLEPSL